MKVCTCLLLLGLLAHISSTTRIRTNKHYRGMNPRSWKTKKIDIKPIFLNEMTKKATVPRRPITTTTPRYSSKDESDRSKTAEDLRTNYDSDDTNQDFTNIKTKFKLRAEQDDDNQRKHFKPDESKSKSKHTNRHFIGEYNAVIDVQLANTELLNALGIFEPVTDKNKNNMKQRSSRYDTTSYQRSFIQTKPVHSKPTVIRALTEIKPKKTQRTTRLKPSSRYSKPLSKLRNNISTLLLEESELIKQLMKDHKLKQKPPTRRNANNSVVAYNFKEYVIKKLDALQMDLQELKHISNQRMRKNSIYTNKIEVSNVTDKYNAHDNKKVLKANVIRLANENKDLNDKENSTMNTESTTKTTTYSKPSVIDRDTVNKTIIDDKNTSKVKNTSKNDAKALDKYKITNSESTLTVTSITVTDATEAVVNTATTWVGTRNKGYFEPMGDDDDPDQNQYITYGQVAAIDDMSEDLEYNMKF